MAEATSPTAGHRYGIARVCRVWELPRSSFYAARQPEADTAATAEAPGPAARHLGPGPARRHPGRPRAVALGRRGPPQGVGPTAGDARHPGVAQAGAAADARACPAFAPPDPHAARRAARPAHRHRV